MKKKRSDRDVWSGFLGLIKVTLMASVLAALISVIRNEYYESPAERKLKEEITAMEVLYQDLEQRIGSLQEIVSNIEHRDDHLYRLVLGVEPLDPSFRNGGIGGAIRYESIRDRRMAHTELIIRLNTRVDQLRRKLYIESVSQDELIRLTSERRELYGAVPAIQPVSNKQLTGIASGFGMRLHPFYEVIMMHTGIDFAAAEGTEVFATADGKIAAADTTVYGYGNMITIDHGHGYQTRYAHLSGFLVSAREPVRRGERIGFVGNTGMSTAPHLHYEVLLNGVQINPVDYFFRDLNPVEFARITQLASVPNPTMGN